MSDRHPRPANSPRQILTASLMGTAIEFFDFYIYATAAVLVFPALFFPTADPATGTLASLATFAIAFLARPIGSARVRPLRRPRRPEEHAGGRPAHDGHLDGGHRPRADLRHHRHRGADPAGALPLRAGPRPRRRMGRGDPARHRERAAGQAGLVRDVPAARRPDRILLLGRHLPGHLAPAHRRAVLRLGLAHSVPRQRRARRGRALRPADADRNAGLPEGARSARAREGADVHGVQLAPTLAHPRHDHRHLGVRRLLPDDGLRAVVGHDRARLHPRAVPVHPAVRRRLLRHRRAVVGARSPKADGAAC